MRRFSLPLVVVASVLLAALLAWLVVSRGVFGDRPARTRAAATAAARPDAPAVAPRALPPFRRLDLSGTVDVQLVQGDTESVAIPPPGKKQAPVTAEVREGTLYVESRDDSRWWDMIAGGAGGRPAPVVVTFRNLETVAAAGTVKLAAGDIKVPSLRISGAGGTGLRIDNLDARELEISGAGAMKAELGGRVADQTVTISGAGQYRGGKLASENATVTVAGAGQVIVNAARTLNATISGAGSVEYTGDPKVTERVSGAGRVRKRGADAAEARHFARAE